MARAPYETMLDEHRRRLARVVERGGVGQVKDFYTRALSEIETKLGHVGKSSDKFTAHQLRLYKAQILTGQAQLAKGLRSHVHEVGRAARTDALRGLIGNIKKLEARYTGAEVVLPIEEASRFEGVLGKRESMLRLRNEQSAAAMMVRNVEGAESALAMSLVTGETLGETTERVMGVMDEQWWEAERVVRTECLSGETLVSGAVVSAILRRWYEGPVVELVTRSGRCFTTTPNHPMLTRGGWMSASSLQEGDDLIGHRGDENARSARDQNITTVPAPIGEIFDAVAAVGVCERRRTAQPDFHGDGGEGEVDIAYPDRVLTVGRFAPLTQPVSESFFSPTHKTRLCFCDSCKLLLAVNKGCGFCTTSYTHGAHAQATTNRAIVYTEVDRDVVDAFAIAVSSNNVVRRKVFEARMRVALAVEQQSRLRVVTGYPRSANDFAYPGCSGVHFLGDLRNAQPGEIEADRIVGVRLRAFRGHVYNLSTPHGYFAINSIYTGNTMTAFSATQADGVKAAAEELPDLMLRWCEHVDDAGNPLDDRVDDDSLVMHGQVAPAGGVFVWPDDFADIVGGDPKRVKRLERFRGWTGLPTLRPNGRETLQPWRPHWGVPAWQWIDGARVYL